MNISIVISALALTFIAGAATAIGSMIAFFAHRTSTRLISTALGLSAGVMIYVSFMDLLPEALRMMTANMAGKGGEVVVAGAFFGGIALIALIDWLIPQEENPHEMHSVEELASDTSRRNLHRTGMMVAVAIAIHNFPEGVATFVSALDGLDVAIPIVVAIAIHNIPEGIAVAVPVYHATGSKNKAFRWSLLAGLAEPLGAIVAMVVLLPFWSPLLSAILLSAVAGIMVYISIDELLPSAREYGHHHLSIAGFIAGMLLMALSLLFF